MKKGDFIRRKMHGTDPIRKIGPYMIVEDAKNSTYCKARVISTGKQIVGMKNAYTVCPVVKVGVVNKVFEKLVQGTMDAIVHDACPRWFDTISKRADLIQFWNTKYPRLRVTYTISDVIVVIENSKKRIRVYLGERIS